MAENHKLLFLSLQQPKGITIFIYKIGEGASEVPCLGLDI